MTALAAALALAGSLLFALGGALQQFEAAGTGPSLKDLLRRPRWLLGGAAIVAGGGLHVAALGIGPLVLVQPIGVASLLFALPIAGLQRGRWPSRGELGAAAVVAAGLLSLVLVMPEYGAAKLDSSGLAVMLAITAITAAGLWAAARLAPAAGRAALLAIAAGVLFGATATVVRVMTSGAWTWFLLAALALPAAAGLLLLQRAYAAGHFAVSFASLQVADPLTAVVFGGLLLGEPLPTGVVPVAAAVLIIGGTIKLAAQPRNQPKEIEVCPR